MQTGARCPICQIPILTNQIIVGLPVIRITDIEKSTYTGTEIVMHVDCFLKKMSNGPKLQVVS